MTCAHETIEDVYVEVDDGYGGTYPEWQQRVTRHTVDIDTGRYRCTRCGEVMYYTGTWRQHWTGGVR
jgi:hypothetical protein